MAEEIIQEKRCTACGIPQPTTNFTRSKLGKYGVVSECKPCICARSKRWRENNPEKYIEGYKKDGRTHAKHRLEKRKQWNRANPEKRKAQMERAYYNNRETILIRQRDASRRYAQSHTEARREHGRRRHEAQRNAPGSFTQEQWRQKCVYWGWRCYLCTFALTAKTAQPDHRKPISRGGANWIANIAPTCGTCNVSKGTKTEREYRVFRRYIIETYGQGLFSKTMSRD